MIQIVLLRPKKNGDLTHLHPVGFPTGLSVSNIDGLFKNLGLIIEKLKAADPKNLENVYYTVGVHTGLGGHLPERNKISYSHQTVIAFDIDKGVDQNRAWDYLPVVAKVLEVSPQSLVFVSSGNGLHILAHLKTPIRSNKYLEETKPNYNEVLYRINNALKDAGLPGECDPSVWDAPRIMRLPNTINVKKGTTRESKLLQYPGLIPLDLDIVKLSGLDKLSVDHISPAQLKKNYPRPDFPQVMSQCEFAKWLSLKPDEVHEPQFMAALGLLGAMAPGDRAPYDNKESTPKEVAQGIFDKASSSKSLQGVDFERKWEHGIRYGAPKCSTISNNWIGGCEKCPHHHKINTPLALKSEEHISSEVNGYWVMGKNGPLHPHYSDVARVYRKENSYVTCEPNRIFTFAQGFYSQTGDLTIKSWLEKKIAHEEHLRESHRVEFVKKILVSNALTTRNEKDLFEQTVKGKLNCKNGVVDVVRGEILPHSPAFGFKYILPYDYEPDQVSEFFIDWLAEVMQNRTELMDAVLDLMAYCLWPTYDDHVFAYFVGEGSNGKSTLLHIIENVLGKENHSSMSISQLSGNRFAPAGLEGKLANISEESSGTDLSAEEVNVIKALSAHGSLRVENKGEKGFDLVNQAKLIFSANKTPRFHESGNAIRRRLLVIPFDYTFSNPDPNVEKKLLAEVPKICSMLVRRIQDNLRANEGKFKVSRGGASAQSAQDKILLAGNSVVEFGRENIESNLDIPEEKYIGCREAYERYKIWCEENNYRMVNSNQFGQTMTHGVLTAAISTSKVIKVGGKPTRVYPRTQWKEEVLQ